MMPGTDEQHTCTKPHLAGGWKSEKPKCTIRDALKNIAPAHIEENFLSINTDLQDVNLQI